MANQNIVERTIAATTDKRIEVANGQITRLLEYLSDWNVIRIGMQVAFDSGVAVLGSPQFIFGLNAGTDFGYGDPVTTRFLGLGPIAAADRLDPTGSPVVMTSNAAYRIQSKIASTISIGASGGAGLMLSAAPTVARSVLILQIAKGSPNFTMSAVSPSTTAGAQADKDDTLFLNAMESLTMADAATALGTGYAATADQSLAFAESTEPLDTLLFYWDRSAVKVEISNVRHRKIS